MRSTWRTGAGGSRFEKRLQHRVQRARAAQHGGGEPVAGRTVAGIHRRQCVQRVLKRAVAVEHTGQQLERGVAGGVCHCGGS